MADLSAHHVEGFILEEAHSFQRLTPDYGYDLVLFTYDEQGYLEPGSVYLQLKASESLRAARAAYVFDVDIRDYNLWTLEEMPVILILFDASRSRAYWLCVQDDFGEDGARQPRRGAKTVRVRVPAKQVVNRRAVRRWRALKGERRSRRIGGEP
jgi:hypothetical protein